MKRMLWMMAALLLLCACQKTPVTEIVVPKDQDTMVDKAAAQQTEPDEPIPDHYKFDYAEGNLSVHVDASVTAPEGDLPVLRVEAKGLPEETVKSAFRWFYGDEIAWQYPKYHEETKEDIRRELEIAKEMTDSKRYLELEWEEEEWQAHLEELQERYRRAPEQHSSDPVQEDGTLHPDAYHEGVMSLNAMSDAGNSFSATSDLSGTQEYVTSSMGFLPLGNGHYPPYNDRNQKRIEPETELPEALSTLKDRAIELADSFVAATGLPMELHDMFVIDDEQDGSLDDLVQPAEHQAIKLYYTRTWNGIPFACFDNSMLDTDSLFALPWQFEYLRFIVDADGIQDVSWVSPLTVGETIVEKSKLLPFSEILAMTERLYPIVYGQRASDKNQIEINIDKIALELFRVREEGVTDRRAGLAIPVWVFYGTVKTTSNIGTEQEWTMYEYFPTGGGSDYPEVTPVLAINAVDGSAINPLLGY